MAPSPHLSNHPALLQPAFSMQQTLRERIRWGVVGPAVPGRARESEWYEFENPLTMKAHYMNASSAKKAVEKSDAKEYKRTRICTGTSPSTGRPRSRSQAWWPSAGETGICETQSAEILDKY